VIARNGSSFIEEFFVRQHFGRLASASLGHQQPFWFYLPVLLAGLFPWTPFLMLLLQKQLYKDRRAIFLLVWAGWVVVFFSVFLNKLPGYLLPALPPFAALVGIAITGAKARSIPLLWSMSLSAALLCFLPSLQDLLPGALLHGLSRTPYQVPSFWLLPAFGAGLLCSALARVGRRLEAISLIGLGICLAVARLVWQVYPIADRTDSARVLWLSHSDTITCVSSEDRARRYGLEYYANHPIPDCN
jgi:4-amino-4-deoxy-L-arabinose transferase-like glycosyltransferase